jgi:hypothetical protein
MLGCFLGYRHFRPMSHSSTRLVAQAVSAIVEILMTLPIRWGTLPLVGLSSVKFILSSRLVHAQE